ncbi:MAG: Rrf2 family iron-sulfur cluster assembly transcriptional regulator [Flavobacteriales bacterium]
MVSVKGPHGGFQISEDAMKSIRLSDVVKAIDGDAIYSACGIGLKECSELKPCPLHERFKEVRNGLKAMLEETTLKDLAVQLENGTAFLKL